MPSKSPLFPIGRRRACRHRPAAGPFPHPLEEDALRPRPLARRLISAGLAALTVLSLAASLTACKTPPAGSALGRITKTRRIVIATDALYPPNEFKQGDQIVGFDIDLGTAIGHKLGVTAEFQDVKFDTILQALQEGKYDLALSSLTDTRERESRFDFVTYLLAGTALLVRQGNPRRLRPDDLSLCGRRVAVEKGTTEEDELMRANPDKPDAGRRIDACRNGHRPAPVRMSFDDQAAANEALADGRTDAVLTDSPVAAYTAKESGGTFAVAGEAYGMAPYGIAMPKRQDDLRDAVLRALKDLISDGVYRRLTAKWGLSGDAISQPRINAAGGVPAVNAAG